MACILGAACVSGANVMIPAGFTLYACGDHADSVTQARDYIKRMGLTEADCRLIRVEGQIRVVSKRRLWDAQDL